MAQPPPVYGQQQMMAAPMPIFNENPCTMTCQYCQANIQTSVMFVNGLLTWLLVALIFIVGGAIFCLCFIPFCVDACKDVEHTCPSCHRVVGKYQRIG